MKYSIFQIVITDTDYEEIDAMEDPRANHPKLHAHMNATSEKFEKAKDFYSKVAEIEASDLEHVFHIGNIGPEEAITRLDRMHSISVGDIVVDGNGIQWGVEGYGFKELEGIVNE